MGKGLSEQQRQWIKLAFTHYAKDAALAPAGTPPGGYGRGINPHVGVAHLYVFEAVSSYLGLWARTRDTESSVCQGKHLQIWHGDDPGDMDPPAGNALHEMLHGRGTPTEAMHNRAYASVSRSFRRLEQRGLVERIERDSCNAGIHLTVDGIALAEEQWPEVEVAPRRWEVAKPG